MTKNLRIWDIRTIIIGFLKANLEHSGILKMKFLNQFIDPGVLRVGPEFLVPLFWISHSRFSLGVIRFVEINRLNWKKEINKMLFLTMVYMCTPHVHMYIKIKNFGVQNFLREIAYLCTMLYKMIAFYILFSKI